MKYEGKVGVNALNGLTSFLLAPTLKSCVNALNGLTSFLRRRTLQSQLGPSKCVNALNGLTSFLQGTH